MHSKKILSIIISSVTLFTVGCGLKLGEQKKTNDVAEIQGGVSCLKDSTASLKAFTKGEAKDAEIDSAMTCLSKTVISFKDNMRGKDKKSFTPGELAGFLKKNFMKDSNFELTPELLSAFMKFKVALVGGDTETLKKSEIAAIADLMLRLKPELVALNPHMKTIIGKWQGGSAELTDENLKEFNLTRLQLIYSLKRVTGVLAAGNREYDTADFADLVVEVMKAANSSSESIEKIKKARGMMIKAKTTLIGGTQMIVGDEWLSIGVLAGEAYSQVLRNRYFLSAVSEKDSDTKIRVYQQMVDDVFSSMPEIMTAHGESGLHTRELVELMNTAAETFPAIPHPGNLVDHLSKIKVVLAGEHRWGSKHWIADDFKTLRIKIPRVISTAKAAKAALENFKPKNKDDVNAPILTPEEFATKEAELLKVATVLTAEIAGGYDLADVKGLIESLKPLLGEEFKVPEKIDNLLKLAAAAKVTLTGEAGTKVGADGLKIVVNIGARIYSHFVEYTYFVNPYKFDQIEFTKGFAQFLPRLRNTISLNLNLKSSHQYTTKELTDLILAAQESEFLSTKLQKESLTRLFDTMWSNILNTPEVRFSNVKVSAFDQTTLNNLSIEVMYWLENQKLIFGLMQAKPEYSKDELKAALSLQIDNAKSVFVKDSALELKRVIEANGFMNYNAKSYLRILTDDLNRYGFKDLLYANISKTLARVLIRSYAGEVERAKKLIGVTQPEITDGFDQIRRIGYDLELLDPNNPNFIAGRFLESNLFLSVSDGDQYSSFEEMNHLVLHIISGISRAKAVESIAKAKCTQKESLILREIEFNEDCLLNLYLEENDAFEDLPEFLKLKSAKNENNDYLFTPEQNKAYYMSLLKAAGHVPKETKAVLLGDAALFPHVVQYVEMIFWRHDVNKDGKLDKQEALAAFPIFAKMLEDFTAPKRFFIKIPDLPGLFIYLLKFGGTPTDPSKMKEFLAFIKDHKCNNPEVPCQKGWDIQSTRHDVGKIFNFIADSVRQKPQDPPKEKPTGEAVAGN